MRVPQVADERIPSAALHRKDRQATSPWISHLDMAFALIRAGRGNPAGAVEISSHAAGAGGDGGRPPAPQILVDRIAGPDGGLLTALAHLP